MPDETVDAVENEEVADSQPEANTLAEVKELLEYYKTEAKKAFEQRDKVKQELRNSKQKDNKNSELDVHIQKLEAQLAEKDKLLEDIRNKEIFNTKFNSLKSVAKELGVKEQYLDKLDKFVSMDDIDVEKAATIKYQVNIMKSNFPDLFQETGKAVDGALPLPKLSTDTTSSLQEQFEAEKAKGLKADLNKLQDLFSKINGG